MQDLWAIVTQQKAYIQRLEHQLHLSGIDIVELSQQPDHNDCPTGNVDAPCPARFLLAHTPCVPYFTKTVSKKAMFSCCTSACNEFCRVTSCILDQLAH